MRNKGLGCIFTREFPF